MKKYFSFIQILHILSFTDQFLAFLAGEANNYLCFVFTKNFMILFIDFFIKNIAENHLRKTMMKKMMKRIQVMILAILKNLP